MVVSTQTVVHEEKDSTPNRSQQVEMEVNYIRIPIIKWKWFRICREEWLDSSWEVRWVIGLDKTRIEELGQHPSATFMTNTRTKHERVSCDKGDRNPTVAILDPYKGLARIHTNLDSSVQTIKHKCVNSNALSKMKQYLNRPSNL